MKFLEKTNTLKQGKTTKTPIIERKKSRLEGENMKGIHIDSGQTRFYIKSCYCCGEDFYTSRANALTCCKNCRKSLHRRLVAGKNPIFKFRYKIKSYESLAGIKEKGI
jgi:hypothetical protein